MSASRPCRGYALGGGSYLAGGARCFVLAVVPLDSPTPTPDLVKLPFLPHGLAFDPTDGSRAVAFEKRGPGAAELKLDRPRCVDRLVETVPQRHFYGHGIFTEDRRILFATEARLDADKAGVLIIRDGKSLEELGEFPTFGRAPHDCRIIDGGQTLVVTNGGGAFGDDAAKGSVAYLDVASGKLLDLVPIADARFNAGHLATSAAGDLVVISAPRDALPPALPQLGAVSLGRRGAPLVTKQEPLTITSRMRGESLSVHVDEGRDVVLVTHPLGDFVSVWRLSDGTSLGTLEVSDPRGIAASLDGAWYLVSHLSPNSVRLSAYDSTTRERLPFSVDPSFLTGSHLYVRAL
jgi:uncharacterized protein